MAQVLATYIADGDELKVGFEGHETNHEALLRRDLDLYADYTGTALHRYLKLSPRPRDQVYPAVRDAARERWGITWLEPFGFDNSYGLIMRAADTAGLGVRRISDLVGHADRLTLGGTSQFLSNDPPMTFAPGGYAGLSEAYGFRFGGTSEVDSGYGASFDGLARGEVDVLADFVVNPRIAAYDLMALDDDRGFFAAYHAAPVVHGDFLARHPEACTALEGLAWRIDNRAMARLNCAMEFEGRDPAELASEFLASIP